jgi:hypothetical protein
MTARLIFAAVLLGAVLFAFVLADGTGWGPT